MDHLLFHCPNLSEQREVIKQFISKYQKEFSAFVNAVDFGDIQQTG